MRTRYADGDGSTRRLKRDSSRLYMACFRSMLVVAKVMDINLHSRICAAGEALRISFH